jgi:CelD/BcsL family acetyltransferase involved in cellulose biosynthesis
VDRVHVSLLGAGISDYLGILAAPEFAEPVAAAVFVHLSTIQWDVCEFSDLLPDSPLLRVKPGTLEAREAPDAACPEIALPQSLDELLARLTPKFRRNLRTAENRLRRCGSIEFIHAGAQDLEKWMRLLFRLHAARWQERHERGMFADDRMQRFHLEAAERFQAAGQLRLTGLESDGVPIAVQYNIRAKDREYYYLSGFDPAYAAASPGALLLREAIGISIAEGCSAIDFLRNGEAYKYDWGARDRYTRRLVVLRSAHTKQVA